MVEIPRRWAALFAAFVMVATTLSGTSTTHLMSPVGAVEPAPEYAYGVYSPAGSPYAGVFEVSGLAPSNQEGMDDVYWAVRDYHPTDERRFLYRMRYSAQQFGDFSAGNGLVIDAAIPINVTEDTNDDWEAVATDQDGNVYIGDTGPGSLSMRRMTDRQIHMLSADQVKNWTTGPLAPTTTWTYTPDTPSAAGLTANVEAMFSIDDQVYLLSRGSNGRVAKLDQGGNGLVTVAGSATLYPALSQVTGAEVSHDGHTMVAITRGNGFHLKSSYIYPRQDLAPLTADEKATKLLAQFGAGSTANGVASEFEYDSDLEFEGIAFGDTGAVNIDTNTYESLRQDDNAYVLMVSDHAVGGHNQVYRIPAQGFRQGVSCSVSFAQDGVADNDGDRVMVEWDGFDADDAYNGSASVWVRRAVVGPDAGGWYYWQANIGRNVHGLEQFVKAAPATKEIRYTLFPRQDLPGGLTNQDMFIAVPCGAQTLGESLTCSAIWNGDGGIDIAWNQPDLVDRSYSVHRVIDNGLESEIAQDLTGVAHADTVADPFATVAYRVEAFSGPTSSDSAECGTLFDPAGELACAMTATGTTDRLVWDRFVGSDLPGYPDANLAKVKVFRRVVGSATWYHQGFFGVNTDTLYEDNRSKSFEYQIEVWVDSNGSQQPLPQRVACS